MLFRSKKASESQMEALKKGMEALKLKREAIKVKKAEKKARIKAGEVIEDSSEDEAPPKPKVESTQKPIVQYVPVKPRKERKDTGSTRNFKFASKEDLLELKTSILDTIRSTPMIKEVEKPVDRVIEKEVIKEVPTTKVLSGSEMLNKIFFNM